MYNPILILIIICFSPSFSAPISTNFNPIKLISVPINSQLLEKQSKNHRMVIQKNLNMSMQALKKCKVIGSISSINLQGNKDLQFNFKYNLNIWQSNLNISIFARPQVNQKISPNFSITLDFLIAEFPQDYYIFNYNITSYQTHIEHQTTRDYELIFLLNGFNNFSKSGNMTHSYQAGYSMYTIHYMSCDGEAGNMGWREDQDYLYFTLMVVPMQKLIQKFKVEDKMYSVDWPVGFKYFYGLKGATDDQFVGGFQKRMGGLIFKTKHLAKDKVYGLVMLPYPDNTSIEDTRTNRYESINIIILSVTAILVMITCYFLYKRCYFLRRMIKWQQNDYDIQTNESTKTDLKNMDISRPKYEINTVEEVEQKYESSRKSSRKNSLKSKPQQIPTFTFKQ